MGLLDTIRKSLGGHRASYYPRKYQQRFSSPRRRHSPYYRGHGTVHSKCDGKKHIIGSIRYFACGLSHIKLDHGNKVYNPYTGGYVDYAGQNYYKYELDVLYRLARSPMFVLTKSCTRIHVCYYISGRPYVVVRHSTEDFLKTLDRNNGEYKIYYVGFRFLSQISECVRNYTRGYPSGGPIDLHRGGQDYYRSRYGGSPVASQYVPYSRSRVANPDERLDNEKKYPELTDILRQAHICSKRDWASYNAGHMLKKRDLAYVDDRYENIKEAVGKVFLDDSHVLTDCNKGYQAGYKSKGPMAGYMAGVKQLELPAVPAPQAPQVQAEESSGAVNAPEPGGDGPMQLSDLEANRDVQRDLARQAAQRARDTASAGTSEESL